ncbi:DUF6873 family GME fold protein [Clostridium sp.]|uniref:DUF6873 family GME fold protein n=1 Tax=Clostridium sp. TaxID=1506 RepID=UPI0026DB70FE|nr:hypothetical protein [Clostridium sp.]MDO5040416.1 hypothetical protein [Clostridium sp.]
MYSFVDYRITCEEFSNLIKEGVIPIKVPKSPLLYEAINGHVDIQLNILDKKSKLIVVHKDIDANFLNILKNYSINFIFSETSLDSKYPKDIILNALITDEILMHNLKYTDKSILNNSQNKLNLNVSQGYTKCSVVNIYDKAFITSDKIIYNTLVKSGYDTLFVPPGDIILEGLDYGFIGGTCGMIGKNKLAFFGNLNKYKYGKEVLSFLEKHNVIPIFLKDSKLIDRGSILSI